ncbi:MAG TPA: hypothetical protein VF882_04475 [Gemmatimonadales bacterium]
MRPRLAVLVALGSLACGGGPGPGKPAPQSPQETLAQFLAAVKANDLGRMGDLWGTERGPAKTTMKADALRERLTVIQKYLDHVGYRVVEGPMPAPGKDNVQTFRIELQRQQSCTVVFPIDLVRARSGGWLVLDPHLESVGTPRASCKS